MCAACLLRLRKLRGICAKVAGSFTLAAPTASACRSSGVRSMHSPRAQSPASRRDLPETSAFVESQLTMSSQARLATDMNPADSDFAKTLVPITALQRYGNTDETPAS